MFSLEKRLFRLVVDGIRAQDGQMVNAELAAMQHFLSPVYLGGAPEAFHKELKVISTKKAVKNRKKKKMENSNTFCSHIQSKGLPKQSVPGCIRNFKMNGALMTNPTTNRGAGPCLAGPTQKGAYFAGNRAHVIVSKYSPLTHLTFLNTGIHFKGTSNKISPNQMFGEVSVWTPTLWSVFHFSDDSFVLNSTFELLFSIRPQSPTGLLLHVGVFSESHYLSVYMLRGEVRPDQDQSRVHRAGFTRMSVIY